MQLRREAKAHDKGIIDAREISIAEALEDEVMQRVWASGKFIDWEKEMFRNAIYHNHDVSVRGGTEKSKYRQVPTTLTNKEWWLPDRGIRSFL